MDPIEHKPTRLYPNSDREPGGINVMPKAGEFGKPLPNETVVQQSENLETNTNDSHKLNSVHTFKDDMATEAAKGGFSIGKIIMASSKREHEPSSVNANIKEKSSNLGLKITVAVVCLLIVGALAYLGLNLAKTPQEIQTGKNPTEQVVNGLLYSEQNVQLDTKGKTRTSLYKDIQKEMSSAKVPSGKIKSIIFTYKEGTSTSQISASDFLNIIAPSAPDVLVRNLKKEYVFGYYFYNSSEPFIVLKASNYDSVFAGMLEWERDMYADLGDLIYKQESISTSTQNSTSTVLKSEYDTAFVDRVISNNDTRILYRPNGSIAFFYTFFNKDTVIITTSEQTLRELIYRLTSGKITR